MRLLKEKGQDAQDVALSPVDLAKLISMTEEKQLNNLNAKKVFEAMFEEGVSPLEYATEHDLITVQDTGALTAAVEAAIAASPKAVEDYHAGKEKAIGAIVGQVMKAMKGQADPGEVNRLIKERL